MHSKFAFLGGVRGELGIMLLVLLVSAATAHAMTVELKTMLNGEAAGDYFGAEAANAGDVNGDGYPDLIVGSNWNDAGAPDAGRAYVYFGGPAMDNVADLLLTGTQAVGQFGRFVGSAGDVNGDGYCDFLVGARFETAAAGTRAGRAYLYFGGPAVDNVADLVLGGPAAYSYLGDWTVGVGDYNDDGYNDFIVGADGVPNGTERGAAYLYFGGPALDAVADIVFNGVATGDTFGWHIDAAGDVNGDGHPDIVIAACYNDADGHDAGRVYVYFGGPGADNVADWVMTAQNPGDNFGTHVAGVGDVDGDGYCDILVGAARNSAGGTFAGRAYIFRGGTPPDAVPDLIVTGTVPQVMLGYGVGKLGDLDGDGYPDFAVGAPNGNYGGRGDVQIHRGGAVLDAVPELVLTGEGVNDWFGFAIGTAGDLNGDGITDILVSAPGNDGPAPDAGRVYLYEVYAGPGETPRGTNVTVIPRDVTTGTTPARLTYDRVTRGGLSRLVTSGSGTPPPAGFVHGSVPRYYDLGSSATCDPGIEVELTYDPAHFAREESIRLFHEEGGVWVDRTTGRDTGAHRVRGRVSSLSPFALFAPANPVTPGPAPSCIDLAHTCVTIPVTISRSDALPMRGFSVELQFSANLQLCGAITQGSYLSSVGGTHFEVLGGGGIYTVDCAILGLPCGATAPTGLLFNVPVSRVGSDGTGTITVNAVTLRDCANAPIVGSAGPPLSLTIDTVPPAAVTNLAATQVKSGNDGDGTTGITLTFTAPGDAAEVKVYRAGFGSYPEYDDGTGAVPAIPGYLPPTPWTLTGVTASGQVDEPLDRDFWYYVVFTKDACGNVSAVSNRAGGTLNYHLGDTHDGAAGCAGDNQVNTSDVSFLGSHYGLNPVPYGDPLNCLDVGPTTDHSVDARPTTDNKLGFEDLMMFAINYGQVSKPWRAGARAAAGADDLTLTTRTGVGGAIEAVVALSASGGLQGLSLDLDYDASVVRPVGVLSGDLLARQPFPATALSAAPGNVDVAVLGRGATIEGEGELALVRFERLAAGEPRIGLARAEGRDPLNRPVGVSLSGAPVQPPRPSVVVGLSAAYPNPFTRNLNLVVGLAAAGDTRLRVFDVSGRLVRMLAEGTMNAGEETISWDGRDQSGHPLASGLYLVRLESAGQVWTRHVLKVE